jgi:hypothetical protein
MAHECHEPLDRLERFVAVQYIGQHIKQEMMLHLVEGVKISLNKIVIKRRRDSVEPQDKKRGRSSNGNGGGWRTSVDDGER